MIRGMFCPFAQPVRQRCPALVLLPFIVIVAGFPDPSRLWGEEFKWKVAVGDTLTVVLEQTTTATSVCDTRQRIESSRAVLKMRWEVTEVGDDSFRTIQSFDSVLLELSYPASGSTKNVELRFDTDRPGSFLGTDRKFQQEIETFKSCRFNVEMKRDGTIVSVEPEAETVELIRSAPAMTPLTSILSAEGIRQMFADAQLVLPRGDVAVGHSWEIVKEGAPASEGRKWRYSRIREIDGREYHEFESRIAKREKDIPTEDGRGVQNDWMDAVCLFDLKQGLPAESTSDRTIKLSTQYRELVIETDIVSRSKVVISRSVDVDSEPVDGETGTVKNGG